LKKVNKSLAMSILEMHNKDLTPKAKRGGAAKHKAKLDKTDSKLLKSEPW